MKYRNLKNAMVLVLLVAVSTSLANSQQTINQNQGISNNGALKPRWTPPKPDKIVLDPHQAIAGVFVLKFAEGSHVRPGPSGLSLDPQAIAKDQSELKRLARTGLDPERAAAQLAQVRQLLSDYGTKYGFKIDSLFQTQGKNAQADSQFVEKSKLERVAGEELADLDLYYVVYAPHFKEMAVQVELMNQLNGLAIVEQVHPDVPSSGAQAGRTPDVNSRQGYLDLAPNGLDGRYIWSRTGGRGDNVHFIDVEYDWVTDHEDFAPSSNQFWGARPILCPYDGTGSEHGTSVMGVIAAPDNGMGVTGFASNVHYGLSTVCRPFDYVAAAAIAVFSGENFAGRAHAVVVANAINAASGALSSGDIMLIEQHVPGPSTGIPCTCNCSQWEFVPMEHYQESFDAIRRATAAGIIVVEAGANGGQNLDRPLYSGRFNRAVRDSHAILVGAANAGDGMVACFSSSSQRIDVYAWGAGVATLGFGDGPSAPAPFNNSAITRHYTGGFSGTSSASAVVAGSVISLQSARAGASLPRLTPDQMRNLLVSTGTPQQDTPAVIAARPIGAQPDLRGAFQRSVLPSAPSTDILVGLNFFGGDYRSFATSDDGGARCSATCSGETACHAWSWVKPGVQGPSAMCWLKNTVPAANVDSNTNSGVAGGARIGQNLFGGDYRNFATANDSGGQCLASCMRDSSCRAWTWVRPGVQGPGARCWMKHSVPAFTLDPNTNSSVVRP